MLSHLCDGFVCWFLYIFFTLIYTHEHVYKLNLFLYTNVRFHLFVYVLVRGFIWNKNTFVRYIYISHTNSYFQCNIYYNISNYSSYSYMPQNKIENHKRNLCDNDTKADEIVSILNTYDLSSLNFSQTHITSI